MIWRAFQKQIGGNFVFYQPNKIHTFLNNIRMVTGPTTFVQGAAFIKAPNDSSFGKVFLNNMNWDSFSSDTEKNTIDAQIALMISNGKTAIFHVYEKLSETQEYRNCQVSKKLIYFVILFID